jgi:hypothetical protein
MILKKQPPEEAPQGQQLWEIADELRRSGKLLSLLDPISGHMT